MVKKKALALSLFLVGLFILATLLFWIMSPTPLQIDERVGDTTVNLRLSDSLVAAQSDCVVVGWQVDGIRSMKLNESGVIGADSRMLCESVAQFEIRLNDDTVVTYSLNRQVALESLPVRLLIVLALVMIVAAVVLTPVAQPLFRVESTAVLRPAARESVALLGVILLITLIGVALRASFLSSPMRTDEAWTFNEFIAAPLSQSLTSYRTTNNHIFHTLLARLSYLTFGNESWALRLPAFFAGVLVIPLVFKVGQVFYGARAGLLAAGLVGASSHLVAYATNARGYSIMTACFLGLLVLAPRLLNGGKKRLWLAFCLLTVIGFYTVPTMIYAFAVVVLWMLLAILTQKPRQHWAGLIARLVAYSVLAGVLTTLLYAPALLATAQMNSANLSLTHLQGLTWDEFLAGTSSVLGQGWRLWNSDLPLVLVGLLVAGVIVATVFHDHAARQPVALLPVVAVVLPLMVFLQLGNTYVRLWLFLLPLYFIIAAAGVSLLVRWVTTRLSLQDDRTRLAWAALTIAITLLTALSIFQTRSGRLDGETGAFDEPEQMVALLQTRFDPQHDYVICSETCHQLRYYFERVGLPAASVGRDSGQMAGKRIFIVVVDSRQTLDEMLAYGLSPDRYSPPELVEAFATSSLYTVDPL